ncbi:NAD(P)-linked oxidoreductase superfamily protein [Dorcoceras hygrometricum]|uniref:NAD(P)-linked oxidoreductase superfamily protein n=1 Tax=Dorcoceras hygrometricum TaxID=472368 RepID=A0A2Z7BHH5_9LAMI|nr:NAD(P)-linked oxidoreductase superfamily protein [Dorcoceras hygrometricum]
MAATTIPSVNLKGCEKAMPVLSMGTASYPPAGLEATKAAVLEAIKVGYRHFDTAFAYGSEKPVGEAIAEALRLGLIQSRDELFVTTKLWNLQLDYVDLYLIHWPIRLTEMVSKTPVAREIVRPLDVKGAWAAMEECKKLGLTKAIGVSNFATKTIQEILSSATIPPAVNQVELNPLWRQEKLKEFCKEKGIHITAYSPLGANNTKWGDNRIVDNQVLADIAKSRGKTTAQVALRWVFEEGVSIVTKSFNRERMKANLDILDWSLTEEDIQKINQLPQRKGTTMASVLGAHDIVLELDALL